MLDPIREEFDDFACNHELDLAVLVTVKDKVANLYSYGADDAATGLAERIMTDVGAAMQLRTGAEVKALDPDGTAAETVPGGHSVTDLLHATEELLYKCRALQTVLAVLSQKAGIPEGKVIEALNEAEDGWRRAGPGGGGRGVHRRGGVVVTLTRKDLEEMRVATECAFALLVERAQDVEGAADMRERGARVLHVLRHMQRRFEHLPGEVEEIHIP